MRYVKVRSWHRVDVEGRELEEAYTRCGRLVNLVARETAERLPLGAKSCETCLRLADRDDDDEAVAV